MEQKDLFSYLFSPAGVVAFGLLIYKHEFGYSLSKSIILGIALGLSSCGLFSGFKNLIFK